MKAKVIYNPIAGRGRAGRVIGHLTRLLAHSGWDFETYHCQKGSLIETDNVDVIIAVGGDGTVNDVINALPTNAPPLALVPTGTSNVLARDLRVSRNLKNIVRVATGSKREYFDLGVEKNIGRKFAAMLGVGFDARIVQKIALRRKGKISELTYILHSLKELPGYKVPNFYVEIDDRQVERSANFVIVANTGCYGGPLLFTPDAKPNDGVFDVFIYKGSYKTDIVRLWGFAFLCYLTRGFIHHFTSQVVRGRQVRLFSDEKVPVQVDGEDAGFTPADIEMIPKALLVKV